MSWEILTGISVLGLSASILLQRILLYNYKTDPYSYVIIFQSLVGILIAGYTLSTGVPNPDLSQVWIVALLCITAYGIGHIFYAKTLQLVDASAFSVLFATHALWMMLIGVTVFAEVLTIGDVVGAAMIFASILLLTSRTSWKKLDTGLGYGLLTGVLFAVAITSWTYVGRESETMSWAAWSFIGGALVALLVRPRSIVPAAKLITANKDILLRMLVLAVLYAVGSVAMLYAYKYGDLSIVSPLRQTGIVVTVLLALLLLPAERTYIAKKLLAAGISLIGTVIILI